MMRSVNVELRQGAIDGSYKQVVKDRGGSGLETGTYDSRRELSVAVYGIVEKPEKECPDMVGPIRTPYTVDTPSPGILVSNQA